MSSFHSSGAEEPQHPNSSQRNLSFEYCTDDGWESVGEENENDATLNVSILTTQEAIAAYAAAVEQDISWTIGLQTVSDSVQSERDALYHAFVLHPENEEWVRDLPKDVRGTMYQMLCAATGASGKDTVIGQQFAMLLEGGSANDVRRIVQSSPRKLDLLLALSEVRPDLIPPLEREMLFDLPAEIPGEINAALSALENVIRTSPALERVANALSEHEMRLPHAVNGAPLSPADLRQRVRANCDLQELLQEQEETISGALCDLLRELAQVKHWPSPHRADGTNAIFSAEEASSQATTQTLNDADIADLRECLFVNARVICLLQTEFVKKIAATHAPSLSCPHTCTTLLNMLKGLHEALLHSFIRNRLPGVFRGLDQLPEADVRRITSEQMLATLFETSRNEKFKQIGDQMALATGGREFRNGIGDTVRNPLLARLVMTMSTHRSLINLAHLHILADSTEIRVCNEQHERFPLEIARKLAERGLPNPSFQIHILREPSPPGARNCYSMDDRNLPDSLHALSRIECNGEKPVRTLHFMQCRTGNGALTLSPHSPVPADTLYHKEVHCMQIADHIHRMTSPGLALKSIAISQMPEESIATLHALPNFHMRIVVLERGDLWYCGILLTAEEADELSLETSMLSTEEEALIQALDLDIPRNCKYWFPFTLPDDDGGEDDGDGGDGGDEGLTFAPSSPWTGAPVTV